jgi:formiminotetrahydrofolate cyclodeaminase
VKLESLTIEDYLAQLASNAPTPGGGAAAGLTAAQGAALLAMAANLTRGEKFASIADQMSEVADLCDRSRERLVALTSRDAAAFEGLMASYKLPKGSEVEKKHRKSEIDKGLRDAATVPLEIIRETAALIGPATILAAAGNSNLVSDVGVALHLMNAAVESARMNVLVNIRYVKDTVFSTGTANEMNTLMREFEQQLQVCMGKVEELLK